jgi:rubredoxin
MENLFECPLCGIKAAKIFARDNPFIIFKCPKCGFVYYDKMSGEAAKGTIEGEKPYGSRCMRGVFVSDDGTVRETYFRTPNSPYGGSFLDALMSMLEELSKHG